jgi:hypothetical protein
MIWAVSALLLLGGYFLAQTQFLRMEMIKSKS